MRLGSKADRDALFLWVATRLGIVVIATVGYGVLSAGRPPVALLQRLEHWDTRLLIEIAVHGYDGDPAQEPDPGLPAFFPGMPLLLRLVHLALPNWVLAGLLISLVAGAVAVVALARLGEYEGPAGTGRRAVLGLLLAPPAVFLFAGYSEALFLGFAIPAWLAARKGNWWAASLLAAGASCVRITGLFLAIALIVEYFTGLWRKRGTGVRRWWHGGLLIVPFLPLVAYSAYQFGRTGDWLEWKRAQEAGWGRNLVWPWESFATTWDSAFAGNQFSWPFRLEIAAAVIGVGFTLWLLIARRWSEFVYVGLQVAALVLSSYYLSIPRSTLLWWPLWLALGRLAVRRPRLFVIYCVLAAPLMVVNAIAYLNGSWAG
ncbi:mannosyltransferase family protein [Rhizohabitans arisaemae]|uniref:mannosyltransferase family protein n=1 Tax=Rhizohabitans arisaemae TaxID=2720610 RepID=UPI0024B04858|nr:mannosyltransferase family protein [Rhizohabitans arisaemae]